MSNRILTHPRTVQVNQFKANLTADYELYEQLIKLTLKYEQSASNPNLVTDLITYFIKDTRKAVPGATIEALLNMTGKTSIVNTVRSLRNDILYMDLHTGKVQVSDYIEEYLQDWCYIPEVIDIIKKVRGASASLKRLNVFDQLKVFDSDIDKALFKFHYSAVDDTFNLYELERSLGLEGHKLSWHTRYNKRNIKVAKMKLENNYTL